MAAPHTSSWARSISTSSSTSAAVYLRAKGAAGARYRLRSGTCATRLTAQRATKRVSCARAIAAGASQVVQHDAALVLAAPRVVKPRQHAADVLVALVVSRTARRRRCERHLGRCSEKFLQLLNRAQPCLVHVDHHPCDDQLASDLPSMARPQAHSSLETRASFRLIPRWTRLARAGFRPRR